MLSIAVGRVQTRLTFWRKSQPGGSWRTFRAGDRRDLQESVCDGVQQLGNLGHQPMGQRQDFEHAHEHHDAIAHGVVVKKPAHVDDMGRAGGGVAGGR